MCLPGEYVSSLVVPRCGESPEYEPSLLLVTIGELVTDGVSSSESMLPPLMPNFRLCLNTIRIIYLYRRIFNF